MSALETFAKIRDYRQRAENYYHMASSIFGEDVRARYLAIADHFKALAEAENHADQLERKRRLEELQSSRAKRNDAWGPKADEGTAAKRDPAGSTVIRIKLRQKTGRLRIIDGRCTLPTGAGAMGQGRMRCE